MKKIKILIHTLIIITFFVWLFCDMLKIIKTPLSYYGMSHWIPELLFIFCVAYDMSDRLSKRSINTITIGIFLYPLLYYVLVGQTLVYLTFGFGAGALFSGVFLHGIYVGIKLKPTNKTCKIIDKKG
jgi:F0F1-type ATP synthase assembly protein I